MRFGRRGSSWVVAWPMAAAFIACGGSFHEGDAVESGASGADASQEQNPGIQGAGEDGGDGGALHDATTVDGGHSDGTAADTGVGSGDDAPSSDASEEPPFSCGAGSAVCNGDSCAPVADGANGVFVSPTGSGSACTESAPCGSVQTAIALAVSSGRATVYLDKGTYTEAISLPTNAGLITIVGGFTFMGGIFTTCNNGAVTSSILSAPAGIYTTVTDVAGTWGFETLSIEEPNTPPIASPGVSTYGIADSSTAGLTLTNVAIQVAAGGAGAGGSMGTSGGTPTTSCSASSCTAAGASGDTGAGGVQGSYASGGFVPGDGEQPTTNATGGPGCNGSAGGDGTAYITCGLDEGDGCGNTTESSGPGNPGCGGTGGGPGTGGFGGGASIGVLVSAGAITFSGVTIQTGVGGRGGAGGPGGSGGMPSAPSMGTSATQHTGCVNTPPGCRPGGEPPCGCTPGTSHDIPGGAAGGTAAMGGTGGAGGGGAGGDSLCYASVAGTVTGTVTCHADAAGIGGLDGTGGTTGQGATGRTGEHD